MSPRKVLLTSLFSLSGIQIVNYVVPIITIPYIVRIIGPDNYGLVNFAQAFAAYFLLIVNYGFEYSATRDISINRNDKKKISEIFSSVVMAKFLLFLFTLLIFLPIVFFDPAFRANFEIYIFSYLIIIGNIFLPVWLFQGLEKLPRLSAFNFFVRMIYAALIFIFITEKDDYLLIPLIVAVAQFVVGVSSFIYSIKVFEITFTFSKWEDIKHSLKEGWKLFLSNISISLYTTSNIVILGIFSTTLSVGYFSAASKIVGVVQTLLLGPMNLVFFPRMSSVINDSLERGVVILKKLTFIVVILMFFASLFILIFSDPIIRIIFGKEFAEAASCLRIISFLPLIIGLSGVFGVQGMLNFKMDKLFLAITFIGAVISIGLNFYLVPLYSEIGTSLSWLITEIFITSAFFITLLKNKINLMDFGFLKTTKFNFAELKRMLK